MRLCFSIYLMFVATWSYSADTPFPCNKKETLSIGLVPMTSANLMSLWTSKLSKQVQNLSCFSLSGRGANNYIEFIRKAKKGDFDVVMVPGHVASYLISTAGFLPLTSVVRASNYVYVVPVDSAASSIKHIDNKIVALPDALSGASFSIRGDLSARHKTIDYQYYQNYQEIINGLLQSKIEVGVLPVLLYNAYTASIRNKIRIIHTLNSPSNAMMLAAPHTSEFNRIGFAKTLVSIEHGSGFFGESFVTISSDIVKNLHRDQSSNVKKLSELIDSN